MICSFCLPTDTEPSIEPAELSQWQHGYRIDSQRQFYVEKQNEKEKSFQLDLL